MNIKTHAQSHYWFTDDKMNILIADKPSFYADFLIRTESKSKIPLKERVSNKDLINMGYKSNLELENDPNVVFIVTKYAKHRFC